MIAGVPMPVDAKEALTRKLGPLPAWGWGIAVGGAILVFRLFRGKAPATGAAAPTSVGGGSMIGTGPDATPQAGDPFSGANSLIQQLQTQLTGDESTIAGLSGSIGTLTDFQTLQTKLISLLNAKSNVMSSVAYNNTALNTYRDALAKCTTAACKSKYNGLIKTRQATITSQNAQVTDYNSQIAALQAQLNGSKAA